MLEHSQLVILTTALKNINPTFKAQFNALTDDTSTKAVLKALDHMEASHHTPTNSNSNTMLYTGPGYQHHRRPPIQQGQQQPQGPQAPITTYPPRQQHNNQTSNQGKWCSLHNS
jgi:hypothetical protein